MELQHHGVRGMKWGVRRFQNKDGSLTASGRLRYGDDRGPKKPVGARIDGYNKTKKPIGARVDGYSKTKKPIGAREASTASEPKKKMSTGKKVAITGAAIAGTALAAYGAKKFHDYIRDENVKIRKAQGDKWFRANQRRIGDQYINAFFGNGGSYSTENINRRAAISELGSQYAQLNAFQTNRKISNDTFGTAVRNVAKDKYNKYRRR